MKINESCYDVAYVNPTGSDGDLAPIDLDRKRKYYCFISGGLLFIVFLIVTIGIACKI